MNESKKCLGKNGCGLILSTNNFYFEKKSQHYRARCNSCQKTYNKKWNHKNSNQAKENKKRSYLKNRETILAKMKENYNTEIQKEKNKNYYKNNKEKVINQIVQYERNRNKTDEIYKFKSIIASSIRMCLNSKNLKVSKKTSEILTDTVENYRKHIENQFENWMTWNNRGISSKDKLTWQIDHIIPVAAFIMDKNNYKDILKIIWMKENLQPLMAKDNMLKKIKATEEAITLIRNAPEIKQYLNKEYLGKIELV